MNALLQITLETLWFFLPAGVANTAPVLVARWHALPSLAIPLDRGMQWRGRRLLGDHKTVRGVVVGLIFGSIVGYIQHLLFETQPILQLLSLVSYRQAAIAVLLGAWLGFGGLLGDAMKSFLKRQYHVAPGKAWWPWDQIDFIIGALLVSIWFVPLTLLHIIIAIVGAGILSYCTSVVGVRLHIKQSL